MRFRAIILIIIFLFGGNGISIDIAKCCDEISGISIGFSKEAHKHNSDKSCCPVFKNIDPAKTCCETMVFSTVINQVPGYTSSYKTLKEPIAFLKPVKSDLRFIIQSVLSENVGVYDDFDDNHPIPILLKKRVLTI